MNGFRAIITVGFGEELKTAGFTTYEVQYARTAHLPEDIEGRWEIIADFTAQCVLKEGRPFTSRKITA